MKTAKQILAGFQSEAAKIKNYAEMQAFKEQYLQQALDEAWRQGMSDAAKIAQITHEEWMQAYYKVAPLPTITIMDAILKARDERKTI